MLVRLMKPSSRNSLAAVGGALVLGGALALEGIFERVAVLLGAALIGATWYLTVQSRGHRPKTITLHEVEMTDALARMHTLFHAAASIALTQPLSSLCSALDAIGSHILRSTACAIYGAKGDLTVLLSRGVSAELTAMMKESHSSRTGLFDLTRLDVVPVPECQHDHRLKPAWTILDAERLRSLMFVPLVTENRAIGFILLFYRRPRSFTAEDVALATAFGSLAAMALEAGSFRQELGRSIQEFQGLAESATDAVWVVDPLLRCRMMNRRGEELVGREGATWRNRPFSEFVSESDQAQFEEKMLAALSGRLQVFDFGVASKDRPLRISVRTTPIYGDAGEVVGVLGVSQGGVPGPNPVPAAVHAGSGRSMDLLAHGIAHSFASSLSSILGHASFLRMAITDQSPDLRHVEAIEDSAESLRKLSDVILGFTRTRRRSRDTFDLNVVVRDTVALIERGMDPRIELRVEMSPDELEMAGDPAQAQRVVTLLVENAIEAAGEGGSVWIRTLSGMLDEKLSHRLGMDPGRCLILGVRDSGQWPDADDITVVRAPYGRVRAGDDARRRRLASASEIISNMSGAMQFGCAGQGATVSAYFRPTSQPLHEDRRLSLAAALVAGGRNQLILVVNEDRDVRELICLALERAGYMTVSAGNPAEARGLIESSPDEIDLVIFDITGPRSGGAEAAIDVLKLVTHTPVIVLCGPELEGQELILIATRARAFIGKPFALGNLVAEVHDVLRSSSQDETTASVLD